MKRLLADTANLGARVSFREVPVGASVEEVSGVVATVVDAWMKNGANHVTVITAEETLVQLLHVVTDKAKPVTLFTVVDFLCTFPFIPHSCCILD